MPVVAAASSNVSKNDCQLTLPRKIANRKAIYTPTAADSAGVNIPV